MQPTSRIYIAGHRGLAGSALTRRLRAEGFSDLITRTHAELDLERPQEVQAFFAHECPEFVILAAAKVGGIHANSTYPVDFLLSNLKIQNNVIEASWRHGVKGLLFLGSSCIYPRLAPQPLKEEYLLTGPLEPTNEPYAIAKIAGIELCQAFNRQYGTRFLSVMPTNLYGPNDNYDLQNSHVLPAFIRKFHLAKLASRGDWQAIEKDERVYGPIPADFIMNLKAISKAANRPVPSSYDQRAAPGSHPVSGGVPSGSGSVSTAPPSQPAALTLWGTGSPLREFLYSDDLADACLFLMQRFESIFSGEKTFPGPNHLFNIGCGEDLPIRDLAHMAKQIVAFDGPIQWDSTKPDGTPKKLLDVTWLKSMGWRPKTPLETGIRSAYQDYLGKCE